ncbi:Splicing factor YJU2 [Galemys pyrenaicus]|uniref:Splicing factor YJU2 n=1 Tax=Galemys pyrenaicus TaxID=202257 RepID=A0A8J6A2B7_GALPY|nr:Splicing factor YJU2 [Galemys pyrenaicus]
MQENFSSYNQTNHNYYKEEETSKEGKKLNTHRVQNKAYLTGPIFCFYIKCKHWRGEITFKTDPESTDYNMEHQIMQSQLRSTSGDAKLPKFLEEKRKGVQKQQKEKKWNNPLKVLKNRTKHSKQEMEVLENIQELKDLNH